MQNRIHSLVNEKLRALKNTLYDPKEGLFFEELHGHKNYHTSITDGIVHNVNYNAHVMPALMASGNAENKTIALNILHRLLASQDTDPDSRTYGIWPYQFEEPLSQMQKPDWNWASFIGRVLLIMELEFGAELEDAVRQSIQEALFRACESIERRNMGVDYTNISLMSSFVLVKTGEIYSEQYYYAKGIRNLKRQLDFVEKNGGFCEYNCPDYGMIDLEETGRMLRYFSTPEAIALAQQLHAECWKVFACHYHVKTGQIAPPHTRCYADIKGSALRTYIYIGTKGRSALRKDDILDVGFLDLFTNLICPEELVPSFCQQGESRMVTDPFYKGYDPMANEEVRVILEKGMPPLTACTFLSSDYCLGTFRQHDMWNQRRPAMAYLEGPEGTVCYRVRCLHDDVDFASAIHTAIQDQGRYVGGISFVTDHGDYHYILTPLKNESITADQLCVEFSLTGAVEHIQITNPCDGTWVFDLGTLSVRLQLLSYTFDNEQIRVEVVDKPDKKAVRLILAEGHSRTIDFGKLEKAFIAYAVEISDKGEEVWDAALPVTMVQSADTIQICMTNKDGTEDGFLLPIKPGKYMEPVPGLKKLFKNGGFFYYDER